jgi:hypothetical protein
VTTSTTTDTSWRGLGGVDARSLVDARQQAHHAAQIIVSAAISYLPRRDDDSHTNMEWLPAHGALATNVLEPKRQLRLALRLDGLELCALEADHERSAFPLGGKTLPDALRWLSNTLTSADLDPARLTTEKHYRIPAHPVETGAPYRTGDAAAFRELAHAYHDAWIVTSAVQSRTPGASDPRCWPHHFDLATLITLQKGSDGVQRTIGVGLSPGDESYPEPYFYVTPYPYPPADALGELALGRWHTTGWVGAVLTATALARGDSSTQRERAQIVVDAAVVECRRALSGI